jgi:hypothetical protein
VFDRDQGIMASMGEIASPLRRPDNYQTDGNQLEDELVRIVVVVAVIGTRLVGCSKLIDDCSATQQRSEGVVAKSAL